LHIWRSGHWNASNNGVALILVVDDETVVLRITRLALERAGHSVITARSPAEAFEAVAKLVRVDVLIVDHSLSADRGRDVAEQLLPIYPEMGVIHMSGWPKEQLERDGSLTPGAVFLSKPFMISQIQAAVARLVS
jgi:CheY-like chemotaxis protein